MVWAYGSERGGGFKDGSEDPLVGQHGGNQVNEGRLPRPRIANEEAVFGPPHRREGPRKELPRPREKRVKVATPVKQNQKNRCPSPPWSGWAPSGKRISRRSFGWRVPGTFSQTHKSALISASSLIFSLLFPSSTSSSTSSSATSPLSFFLAARKKRASFPSNYITNFKTPQSTQKI